MHEINTFTTTRKALLRPLVGGIFNFGHSRAGGLLERGLIREGALLERGALLEEVLE